MVKIQVGVESPGGTQKLIEALEREREDSIWLSENMLRLVKEYGIQFAAIRNQAVIPTRIDSVNSLRSSKPTAKTPGR